MRVLFRGCPDLQFEELLIAEAIRLTFHRLDLGVGALQGTSGDRVVVVGQDALLVLSKVSANWLQHPDARGTGPGQPIPQDAPSRPLVRLAPDLPQVFLEVVGRGQRLIERSASSRRWRSLRSGSRFSGFFSSSQRVPLSILRSWSLLS